MKSKMFLVCCFLLFCSVPVYATPYYSTGIRLGILESGQTTVTTLDSTWDSSTTEATSSLTGSYQDEERTVEGVTVSTTINYDGQASSSSGALQSMVTGEKLTEIIDDATESSYNLAEVEVEAYANFFDTLTVSGASDLSYIQFYVSLDGFLSDYSMYVTVDGSVDFFSSGSDWDNESSIDLISDLLEVDENDEVYISLKLITLISFDLGYYEDTVELTADFYNTLTIGQFSGYNDAGELVDLSSVVGSDGYVYDTLRVESSPVPEPSTMLLLSAGLLSLVGGRRKF